MEGNNKQGYLADLALGMQYKFWASFRQQHKKPLKSFFCWSLLPPVVRTLIYGFLDPVIRSSDLLKGKCAISQKKNERGEKRGKEKKHRVVHNACFKAQFWTEQCGDTSEEKCFAEKNTARLLS